MARAINIPIRFEVISGEENFCHGARASVEFLRRKQLHNGARCDDQLVNFIEHDGA